MAGFGTDRHLASASPSGRKRYRSADLGQKHRNESISL